MNEYDYEYEWDSKYCYPNSSVLKNRLGIQDAERLSEAERRVTAINILEIMYRPVRGRLDFKHLCAIHRAVFRDIFDWVGKPRTANNAKGNPFCMSNVIHEYADSIFNKLKADGYLLGKPAEEMPEALTWYLSEINVLHPFREGNGRAQRIFIGYLAQCAGYHVDFSDVSSKEMLEASVSSFDKEYDQTTAMFCRIISPITLQEQQAFRKRIGIDRAERER